MIIDLKNISIGEAQNYLQHAVAPRPICLASTIDKNGNVNLSPFSFFNIFSSNPPVLIFSPALRVRDGSAKHTLENVLSVPEVVIHICDYDMLQQVSLASCDYARGVDEFLKAGFTKQPATLLKPPMVKEAKIKMECRVNEIKALGHQGGAGNLIICEVLRLHIDSSILGEDMRIDQKKMQHVARLGGDWYCRVNGLNLFKLAKPGTKAGIGVDELPLEIQQSIVFTKNHLAQLATVSKLPTLPRKIDFRQHEAAKELLEQGFITEAWELLAMEKNQHDDKRNV
jgi:flavin reductase (DIM6/NTAB) family NADH-FMN oxidoreductase RutF